ncbi:MAG: hypothetical protein U0975_10985 [Erythrobacter sp.]|nr:hypothetical protein [Erythrobacter sp.]
MKSQSSVFKMRLRLFGTWLVATLVAAPASIVLHELAHYLAALGLGFSEVRLHFSSVSYTEVGPFWDAFRNESVASAERIADVWKVGAVSLAGIAATWILALAACMLAVRRDLTTFTGALLGAFALVSPLRGYTALSYIIEIRPNYPDAFPSFDEFQAAKALGVPVDIFVVIGVLVVLVCWVVLSRKLKFDLLPIVPALAIGTVGGIVMWMLIGPHILA